MKKEQGRRLEIKDVVESRRGIISMVFPADIFKMTPEQADFFERLYELDKKKETSDVEI